MSPEINKKWMEVYLRAALEVDGQKVPGRIVAAREAVAGRLKDLEGSSDHHAERHEMQSALAALTYLEDEARTWPTIRDCGLSLIRALDQSKQVQDKVEQAASDLSSVNAVLKDEIANGVPLAKVEHALNQSEAVEVKVQEAAEELVDVNEALSNEIDERYHLENRLSESASALCESQAEERRSRQSALHDTVTGLPNLTLFDDRLRNALAQAERHSWRLAVMFIDLDEFKSVNDMHGHDVGDRVLQMVGQRLQSVVRSGDTIGRRSGDEFLFLMLEAKEEANVAAFAVRIALRIAEACEIDGVEHEVKASVGIALYPEDGRSAQELLKKADVAMYAAKQHKQGPVFHSRIPHTGNSAASASQPTMPAPTLPPHRAA